MVLRGWDAMHVKCRVLITSLLLPGAALASPLPSDPDHEATAATIQDLTGAWVNARAEAKVRELTKPAQTAPPER